MKNKTHFLGLNIKFLRARSGLSQAGLAADLDMSRVKLNSYENGHRFNMSPSDLLAVADRFGLSLDVLLKTNLASLTPADLKAAFKPGADALTGKHLRILATTVNARNRDNIEIVSHKAVAGYPTGFADPNFIESLPHFSLPILSAHKKYRMFQLSGDSMLPIPDQSFVIASYVADWTTLPSGKPYILVTQSDGIVFKIAFNHLLLANGHLAPNGHLLLHSLNLAYTDYPLPAADLLEVWQFEGYFAQRIPSGGMTLDRLADLMTDLKDVIRPPRK